ncbi:hypothetical protein C6369_007560 [Rhodococcus rhodochrous]|nr:hypothetical protein C6369_007560 [Rhodococcus rhodochrous]
MHGRSEFIDSDDETQRRLLVRLWLAMENGRPLPFDFDRGVNHDGVARGGVPYTESHDRSPFHKLVKTPKNLLSLTGRDSQKEAMDA